MSMGWGQASAAEFYYHGGNDDLGDIVQHLDEGEVAVADDLGALYGSPAEMADLGRRLVAEFGTDADTRLTWEPLPTQSDPTVPSKTQIAAALAAQPGRAAIVSRNRRSAPAHRHARRITEGREFGPGFQAEARQLGSEHRVYAWAIRHP